MLTVLNSSHDPFYNQAFEEYVFEHFREGEIFLLWQNDPAVIVGSYQNICREVHVERLRQLGIPVIRRITGGGTVYHDLGNLNYTYISDGGAAIDYDQCLGPILAALNDIGVTGMTVTQVMGCGLQKGSGEKYRGAEVDATLIPKVKVEVVVSKIPVDKIIDTATKVLYTGHIGDGKIFVYNVAKVVKVRTGEVNYAALQDVE